MGKKVSVGRDKERGEIERLGQERDERKREIEKNESCGSIAFFQSFFY